MRKVLSFALGLIALSPIAVSAEEMNRRLYPNAYDRVRMSLRQGSFTTGGDVTAFEQGDDTFVVVTFGITQSGQTIGVSYDFNCNTQTFRREGMTALEPFNETPFVEDMGLVRFYGNQFCAIDRGMNR